MKFAACADLHITNDRPQNRKDDYLINIMEKFEQILSLTYAKTDTKLLVIAGDLFDSAKVPYWVTREVIKLLKIRKLTILVVPGQHDLRYHKVGLNNTPLGLMEIAGVIKILSNEKAIYHHGISFIGAGWNEEPMEDADVIVMHRTVTNLRDTIFEAEYAKDLLDKYNCKCIISGDNHRPHYVSKGEKLNINCGSMVRKAKNQIGYAPNLWIIDTDYGNPGKRYGAGPIPLTIIPDEDVFDFDKIERENLQDDVRKEAEKDIDDFISTLPSAQQNKPEFKLILATIVAKAEINKKQKNILNEVMEEAS